MEGEKSEIVAADDMPYLNFFTKVTLFDCHIILEFQIGNSKKYH